MICDPLRREFRLSLQAYPRPCPVERGDEVGIRVLQRVEEDAVGIEPADHLREFVQIPDAPNLYWALSSLPQPLIDIASRYSPTCFQDGVMIT